MARYANVNNYLAAARAGSQGLLDSLAAIQATSPDFASLAEQSFKNQASEEVLAMNLSGKSVENAIRNRAQLDLASLEAKELEYKEEARRDTVRKAGRLAARAERLRNAPTRPELPELEIPYIPVGAQPMSDEEHAYYQRQIQEAGQRSEAERLTDQKIKLNKLERLKSLKKQLNSRSDKPNSTNSVEEVNASAIAPAQVIGLPKGISLAPANLQKKTSNGFTTVQYVSGTPELSGMDSRNGLLVYDPVGHGGQKYHDHIQFVSRSERDRAANILRNSIDPYSKAPYKITSLDRSGDPGAHGAGTALDVAPPVTLPLEDEVGWSRAVRETLGLDLGF